MSDEPLCQVLEWDSSFFGFRIARVLPERLGGLHVDSATEWLSSNDVTCGYWLADPEDAEGIHAAQAAGFRFVDVRVTFGRRLEDLPPVQTPIGPHREEDLPEIVGIARASHHQSRFYADPGFSDAACDDLYQAWIERSCSGWAGTVLVPRVEDLPAGYLSCHVSEEGGEKVGQIGLVAIAPSARGRGVGRELVASALDWFSRAGCARVSVVTQGRNLGAMRLYEGAGFRVTSVRYWFHTWPNEPGRSA